MDTNECEDMDTTEAVESESIDSNTPNTSKPRTVKRNKKSSKPRVYLPSAQDEDVELECDKSAYVMLHEAQTGYPCLSFDIIRDSLGDNRESFPLTTYVVAGTQAESANANRLMVIKFRNMNKTQKNEDDDDEDESSSENSDLDVDEDEVESKKPQMTHAFVQHPGCVNRVRCTNIQNTVIAASWSELGRVNIWNLAPQLEAIENGAIMKRYISEKKSTSIKPVYSFRGHQTEGFGIDWSPVMPGVLATGDCRRDIHIWSPQEGGTWNVDQKPLVGHTASVEDLQWSPNERHVLASCSVDKSIRIWDTRSPASKACKLTAVDAHESDINVISWNKNEPFIVSGGDDGVIHIWDLRQFQENTPVATFKHHTSPVTTVEWNPHEGSIFASGGSDNQIALWDLSVERDTDDTEEDVQDLPQHLLFIHQGQKDIKELHWHSQLPGVIVSTAESGFNIFRTISV